MDKTLYVFKGKNLVYIDKSILACLKHICKEKILQIDYLIL